MESLPEETSEEGIRGLEHGCWTLRLVSFACSKIDLECRNCDWSVRTLYKTVCRRQHQLFRVIQPKKAWQKRKKLYQSFVIFLIGLVYLIYTYPAEQCFTASRVFTPE